MLFGNSVGYLGLTLSGYQTYIAFTDGDITGNDILGAASTALSAASYSSLLLEWSVLLDVLLVLFLR